jgi:ComF family protein
MENLLNIIFTPECLFCGKPGDLFCLGCKKKCRILKRQRCLVCDKPSDGGFTHETCKNPEAALQLVSVFSYEGVVRDCIRGSKFGPKQFMSLKALAKLGIALAYKLYGDTINYADFTVVPIPASKEKDKARGFNQTEIIADALCWRFSLKKNTAVLARTKETTAQYEFGRKARFENLKNAFTADQRETSGGKFLLVDDICTTGATFLEASRELYKKGASEVKCFALSKKVLL